MPPESSCGARVSLWPPSRSCIIPLVATGPTPNTLNTQFPPNSPNCQPSVGIWEHLANRLEHSWNWWKTYTKTATVRKYPLSTGTQTRTSMHRVGPGQLLSLERYAEIFGWVHFQIFLLVCYYCGHDITGGEGLSYKNRLVLVIIAFFNAQSF